jgi:DNA-binding NarL/FixJ family response regulator
MTEQRAAVLDGILKGLLNKEIGAKLNLSESTVKYHVEKILKLYGVTSRRDLIAKFGHFEVSMKWVPNEKENRQ